jgi:hypothetical protein
MGFVTKGKGCFRLQAAPGLLRAAEASAGNLRKIGKTHRPQFTNGDYRRHAVTG